MRALKMLSSSEFGRPGEIPVDQLTLKIADTPKAILAAQRLHTAKYLLVGYIQLEDISENGTLKEHLDPYKDRSTYFILIDKNDPEEKPIATIRIIEFDPESPFPLIENMETYETAQDIILGMQTEKCFEISGFAKLPETQDFQTLVVYRDLWQHALKSQHDKWFVASDTNITKHLKAMFGAAVFRIGDTQHYLGSPTDPMILDAQNGLKLFLEECREIDEPQKLSLKKVIMDLMLEGYNREVLSDTDKSLMTELFGSYQPTE